MLNEYLWCVIVGGIFCFSLGFGMGANDVSNNFGTSIGSKSITLKKAIVIAAIFEFVGSIGLGANVTDSVRKGVYDPEWFGKMPDILLMANMCALISGTFWLLFASQFGLPVSTTHSLIGAMTGCGLAISGRAVKWNFIGLIVASWIFSPILAAICAIIYFGLIRRFILESPRCIEVGMKVLWLLLLLICTVCSIFFMLTNPLRFRNITCTQRKGKGPPTTEAPCVLKDWMKQNLGLGLALAIGVGIALTAILCPFVYLRARKTLRNFDLRQAAQQPQDFSTSISIDDRDVLSYARGLQSIRTRAPEHSAHLEYRSDRQDSPPSPLKPKTLLQVNPSFDSDRSFKTDKSFKTDQEEEQFDNKNPSILQGPGDDAARSNFIEEGTAEKNNGLSRSTEPTMLDLAEEAAGGCTGRVKEIGRNMPWNADLHAEAFEESAESQRIAVCAQKFDPKCECFFMTVQIISASLSCLLHGSNDVSNAAAPYASVYSIYQQGGFSDNIAVPIWILILGGAAISLGLTFLGYKVIRKIGIELIYISPSRGFCIEVAASTIMLIASSTGLPLSTTHVTVGAMLGVGLLDRQIDPQTNQLIHGKRILGLNFTTINWRLLRKIATGWVGTLIICALISYLLFNFAIHSPTVITTRYIPIEA